MASLSWAGTRMRRALDVVLAVFAAIVLSPLLVIVAVAVRVGLGSPVIFRQQRAGLHGVAFDMPKFRSMTNEVGPDGRLLADEDRMTRLGALLRASSLDELPQLWCVLTGKMSMVGPRPLPVEYQHRYSFEQRRRTEVRPGLTGWAQVNGRNAVSWPEKLALDVDYVDRVSPWLDLVVLVRTPLAIISARGITDGTATVTEFVGVSADANEALDESSVGRPAVALAGAPWPAPGADDRILVLDYDLPVGRRRDRRRGFVHEGLSPHDKAG